MTIEIDELSGPGFESAIKDLMEGQPVLHSRLSYRLKITGGRLIVTNVLASESIEYPGIEDEIDWIAQELGEIAEASREFKERLDTLDISIAMVDSLEKDGKAICMIDAASLEAFDFEDYDFTWAPGFEETEEEEPEIDIVEWEEPPPVTIKERISDLFGLVAFLLKVVVEGAAVYFLARYIAPGTEIVAAIYAVVVADVVFMGESVVEAFVLFGMLTVAAYFVVDAIPRAVEVGLINDFTLSMEQLFIGASIGIGLGLAIGILVRLIGSRFE